MVAVESGGHGEETAARMLAFPSWMACCAGVLGSDYWSCFVLCEPCCHRAVRVVVRGCV